MAVVWSLVGIAAVSYAGVVDVAPTDWSKKRDLSYAWYDQDDLDAWVNGGIPLPPATPRPVAHADGTPNPPLAPSSLLETFSQSYSIGPTSYFFVSQPFARADVFDLTVEVPLTGDGAIDSSVADLTTVPLTMLPSDESPTLEEQMAYLAYATGMTEDDHALMAAFLPRYERREALMRELKSIVLAHFSDDSVAIQAAIDQVASDPSLDTVELAPGTFHLGRQIVLTDFHGAIRGAAMHLTQLVTVPGGMLRASDPEVGEPFTSLTPSPAIFETVGGDTTFSDFAIHQHGIGEFASHGILTDTFGSIAFGVHPTGVHDLAVGEVRGTVERVRFTSEVPPDGGFNGGNNILYIAIGGEQLYEIDRYGGRHYRYTKPVTGRLEVASCESYGGFNGLVIAMSTLDAELVIGGAPGRGNRMFDAPAATIFMDEVSRSRVTVSHNEVHGSGFFSAFQGAMHYFGNDFGPQPHTPLPEPSSFWLAHNRIRQPAFNFWSAFELVDYGSRRAGLPSVEAVVAHNTYRSEGFNDVYAFVFGFGIQDLLVANNTLTGDALVGITGGAYGDPTSGWMIQGNNVRGLDAELAPILLGPATSEITVVGGGRTLEDAVLDLGVDNTLVGVGVVGGRNAPGPEVSEMQQKRRMMSGGL